MNSSYSLYPQTPWWRGFLGLIALFIYTHSSGQSPYFRNYNKKQGLPSAETYCVFQDSKGYIWCSSDAGVARYDGYEFKVFTTSEGLADNTVFHIYEDRKGRIWFTGFSGKVCYYYRDTIHSIRANASLTKLLGSGIITSLHVDEKDMLWLGAYNCPGVLRIASAGDSFKVECDSSSGAVYYALPLGDGYIWGKTTSAHPPGLLIFNYPEKKIELRLAFKEASGYPMCLRLSDGGFLFAHSNQLSRIDKQGIVQSRTFDSPVISIKQDRAGDVWIGFLNKGVMRFTGVDIMGAPAAHYFEKLSVSSVEEDNEGGLWFSTLEDGLYYLRSPVFTYYTRDNGLSGEKVLSLWADTIHWEVWAGFANGQINILGKKGVRQLKLPPDDKAELNAVQVIHRDRQGNVWIGGKRGIYIPAATARAQHLYVNDNLFAFTTLAESSDDTIWLGNYSMVYKVTGTSDRNIKLETTRLTSRINALCVTDSGLWVGTQKGLYFLKDGQLINYSMKHPLLSGPVNDIRISGDKLWMSTKEQGVCVMKGGSLKQVSEKDGLPSNICRCMYIDNSGNVWVSTSKGLSRITDQNEKFRIKNYTAQQGLIAEDILQISGSGEELYLATSNGVISFGPGKLAADTVSPPVYINRIIVNNRTFSQPIEELPYDENFITISFTGLSYLNPAGLRYKYKMEGVEDWMMTENRNVQYTTLPPGNYRFTVYAVGYNGVMSREPATFTFSILPPFWATWWFRVLAIIIIIGILAFAIKARTKRVLRREQRRSQLEKKIAELEMKALRSQMNPHFVFNSLNSIQHFILGKDEVAAYKYLSKFSRLMRNVLEHSEHLATTLQKEKETLLLYLELEALRFEEKFEYDIFIDPSIVPGMVEIPSMLIQPYVENAIWHGLMHKRGKGKVYIVFERNANSLKCSVIDNGIGREESKRLNAEKERTHQAMGMMITEERLALLNQKHKGDLSVKVIDLYSADNAAAGTRIELDIPLLE